MREKDPSAELKDILFACTFANVARAVEPFSRRWRATPSYARATEAFEALPGIVRKRVANLKVVDSAALVIQVANRIVATHDSAFTPKTRRARKSGASRQGLESAENQATGPAT